MNVDSSIFKAYDIRGIVPDQLTPDVAHAVGRSYATLVRREQKDINAPLTVAVGHDMRVSSPELKERLIAGIRETGVNVVEVGLASTPMFYFSVGFYGYDGGVQVSASHNPKEYNGFKMVRSHGRPIGKGTGMEEIRAAVEHNDFLGADKEGTRRSRDGATRDMVEEQRKGIPIDQIKPFTIVVDAANAMGAQDVEAMFAGLPCTLIKMNFQLDGTFPVHQPDPLDEKNLEITQAAVQKHQADLGIVPDGDGDRYFFIDEQGNVLRQEILRGIMAQIELAEHPGATVAYDIRPGRITRDMIEAAHGKPLLTKVGHSLIKASMIEHDAIFGGESSGHYFYKESYGTFEMPVKFVLKFLVWLSQQDKPLSEATAPYRTYFHSGEVNSTVTSVEDTLTRIRQTYADGDLNMLDGVTVEFPDWWFNVRGSNTEPLIRLNLEATTKELMEQKRDEVLGVIRG